MKSSSIAYKDTGFFPRAVTDYLDQEPLLRPYFSFPPTLDGFRDIIKNKRNKTNRELLHQVVKGQYSKMNRPNTAGNGQRKEGIRQQASGIGDQAVNSNIDLLLEENTYTITTGHQLNIFTGPLYFIYKIVTAIRLANDLKAAFPAYNFVPVYWMATEDHDFEEINHAFIGETKLVWNADPHGATGRINPASMDGVIREYERCLGASENTSRLSGIIREAYLGHSTLADATRYLVNELFAGSGLVIIDADNKDLKNQFAGIIESDIIEQNSFREINKSTEELYKTGYRTEVNSREINFFYLDNELRERIVREESSYRVLNSSLIFSEEELRNEIRESPEKFSPNVTLRPLYQELILPNLAYIGGGAEIIYWLQLKRCFDFYKVDFPVLVLRNSAMLADEAVEMKLHKSGFTFRDIFKEIELLKREWVLKHSEHDLSLNTEWQELQNTFQRIKSRASRVDPSLAPSTEAISARLYKALMSLEKKLIRAEKKKHSTSLARIERIKGILFPNGVLQERHENFGSFYVKYGDALIPGLLRNFDPLDFKFTILH